VKTDGSVAAEATVELVLVDLSAGPGQRRLIRRLPENLNDAINRLQQGAA
jgi:acyl-CoA thioester hydrolase